MNKRSSIASLFLVFFLDNFSFAIVFPIFSRLLLLGHFDILPESFDPALRHIFLGILVAIFPLALLIGAPIIGDISDKIGRKKIFCFSIAAIAVGHALTAIGITEKSFLLLVASRLITGFFASNLTLCFASLADLSLSEKSRAKNFSSLIAITGVAWAFSMLSSGLFFSYSPALPLWIAALLSVINFIVVTLFFKEPKPATSPHPFQLLKFTKDITTTWRHSKARFAFVIEYLFLVSWLMVLEWFSTVAILEFHARSAPTSLSLIFIGVCWFTGSALINRYLINYFSVKRILFVGLACLPLLFFMASQIENYIHLTIFDCLIATIASIVAGNLFILLSLASPSAMQGKVMGLVQATFAAAQTTAPLVDGLISAQHLQEIYATAAVIMAVTFVLFLLHRLRHQVRL